MTTQILGKEAIQTLRGEEPAYRLREVDQVAPAGMWQIDAQGADLLFQAASAADWSTFTTVVTMTSAPGITIHGTITFSGTVVFSANVRLDDDITLAFGTSSISTIYSDGVDTYWNLRNSGTGSLMVAIAAGYPAPDGNNFHFWKGDAPGATANTNRGMVLENSSNISYEILIPSTAEAQFRSTSEISGDVGTWLYAHSAATNPDTWKMFTLNTPRVYWSASELEFQQEQTISTSTGALILEPFSAVGIGAVPLNSVLLQVGKDYTAVIGGNARMIYAGAVTIDLVETSGDASTMRLDQTTFDGAFTITNAATLAIAGAPIEGAATLTNQYALHIEDGNMLLAGTYPKLILQDTTNSGQAAVAYIAFRDSGDVEKGWIGDGSAGNDDIYLAATGVGAGNLRLEANAAILINADTYLDSNDLFEVGNLNMDAGTEATPSIRFAGNSSSGLFDGGSGAVAVSVSGDEQVRLGPTGLHLFDAGLSNSDQHIYSNNTQDVGASATLISGSANSNGLCIVTGQKVGDGATRFVDLVITNFLTHAPYSPAAFRYDQNATTGSVATRTYTTDGGNLMLVMSADAYDINVLGLAAAQAA